MRLSALPHRIVRDRKLLFFFQIYYFDALLSVYSYFYEMEFSIHLMTYNCEKFVSQCLQSIVEQKTNFPFEIVIGDDASTDKTIEIIKSYMNHHENINVKIITAKIKLAKGPANITAALCHLGLVSNKLSSC